MQRYRTPLLVSLPHSTSTPSAQSAAQQQRTPRGPNEKMQQALRQVTGSVRYDLASIESQLVDALEKRQKSI